MNSLEKIYNNLVAIEDTTGFKTMLYLYSFHDQKFITLTPKGTTSTDTTTTSLITENDIEVRVRIRVNDATNLLTIHKELISLYQTYLIKEFNSFKLISEPRFVLDTDGQITMIGLDLMIRCPLEY